MQKNIFTLLFLWFPFFCFACSCGGSPSFCDVVNSEIGENLIILSGKKLSDIDYGMEIEVHQIFRGEESRSKIMVWGDNGILCRKYTSGFEIGGELILALSKLETAGTSAWGTEGEEIGDYVLSICGLHYTKCNDSTNPYTGEIEDVSACLGDNFCDCEGSNRSDFYPNPTRGIVRTKIKIEEEESNTEILVYNISGQIIRKYEASSQFISEDLLEIDLSDLASGVYFISHQINGECGNSDSSMTKVMVM